MARAKSGKINGVLTVLILATTLPFLVLLTNVEWQLVTSNFPVFMSNLVSIVASILGLIGAVLFIWQFLLGLRYFVRLFTPDIAAVNKTHQTLGKWGIVFVLMHPILELTSLVQALVWVIIPNLTTQYEVFVTYGRIALMVFLVVWVTSAVMKGNLKYRPWLYIHFLTYPLLFLVFVHSLDFGTFILKYMYLQALWDTLFTMFVLLCIYRLYKFAGLGKSKYTLVAKKNVGNNISVLEFAPIGKRIVPKVGQFAYIQSKRFGEDHPYSVMSFNEKNGNLIFGVQLVGNQSKRLGEIVVGADVYIDGPYGVFTTQGQNAEPKVIIAGGIGVTPFIDLVNRYSSGKTIMINSNSYLGDVVERDFLKGKLAENYYDFLSQDETIDENILNSRLNANFIGQIVGVADVNSYRYFLCGSRGFMKGIKEMLSSLKVNPENIFNEDFEF